MSESLPHLDADAHITLAQSFAWQEARCAASGSHVAAALLRACADWARHNGEQFGIPSQSVRFGDHVPLRVMAAVHCLALTRDEPALGMYFPTLGGHAPVDANRFNGFRELVTAALTKNHATVHDFISRPPQTNEPGRAAVLQLALEHLGTTQPIDLHELGCSAGLNLVSASTGPFTAHIASAGGCDVHPVDVTTVHGRALLSAYTWVDDVARFNRLGDAIQSALAHPPRIACCPASTYLSGIQPEPEHTTVLWQSALSPYLSHEESAAIDEQLQLLAQRLPADSRLAHVAWEDAGDTTEPNMAFALRVRTWRKVNAGGDPERAAGTTDCGETACEVVDAVIARGSSHGAHLVATTGQ